MSQTAEIKLQADWKALLHEEFSKPYSLAIKAFILKEKAAGKLIYPPSSLIFHAFELCPPQDLKVVILGQDPYHGPGQAHGLCFSVPEGIAIPPSLVNIFKEIQSDLGQEAPKSGNLERWASQGILLLNAILTVNAGEAASHKHSGWENFTDAVIRSISEQQEGIVFLLWGRFAIQKSSLINASKHLILTAAHPSPLSAYNGFFGCKHFSKTNEYLISKGKTPIKW